MWNLHKYMKSGNIFQTHIWSTASDISCQKMSTISFSFTSAKCYGNNKQMIVNVTRQILHTQWTQCKIAECNHSLLPALSHTVICRLTAGNQWARETTFSLLFTSNKPAVQSAYSTTAKLSCANFWNRKVTVWLFTMKYVVISKSLNQRLERIWPNLQLFLSWIVH